MQNGGHVVLVSMGCQPHGGRVTHMRQYTRSGSVQIIACCPYGTKPLPEPIEFLFNVSEIRIKIQKNSFNKIWFENAVC